MASLHLFNVYHAFWLRKPDVVVPMLSRLGKEVTMPPRDRGLAGSLTLTEFTFLV